MKRCSECAKHIENDSRSGKCLDCLYPSRKLPIEKKADYRLMVSRIGSVAALQWVMDGKPVAPSKTQPTVTIRSADVIMHVSKELGVERDIVTGKARVHRAVYARAAATMIMYRAGMPLAQIGRRLNRHHTSIINLMRNYQDYAAIDARLDRVVNQFRG